MSQLLEPNRLLLQISRLPVDEQAAARLLDRLVGQLYSYRDKFYADLTLYNCIMQTRANAGGWENGLFELSAHKWPYVPLRDGAWMLYHFRVTIDALGSVSGKCATLRPSIDHRSIKEAGKKVDALCPNIFRLRHALGHSALFQSSEKQMGRGLIKGAKSVPNMLMHDTDSFTISEAIGRDGQYTTSYEGEVFSYNLNHASLDLMASAVREINAAFQNSKFIERFSQGVD